MQAARGATLTDSATSRPRRLRLLLFGTAVLVYVADVVTKHLAVSRLDASAPVELVGHYFRLTLVRNPGAAFSTGTSFTVALSFVAIAAVLIVLYVSRRVGSPGWAVALGLLLGGVSGNLTDRIFRSPGPLRGHVVDFLQLPNWPVFNLADISINSAAALIVILSLRGRGIDGRRHSDEHAVTDPAHSTATTPEKYRDTEGAP
jgi:signal peptidase II